MGFILCSLKKVGCYGFTEGSDFEGFESYGKFWAHKAKASFIAGDEFVFVYGAELNGAEISRKVRERIGGLLQFNAVGFSASEFAKHEGSGFDLGVIGDGIAFP